MEFKKSTKTKAQIALLSLLLIVSFQNCSPGFVVSSFVDESSIAASAGVIDDTAQKIATGRDLYATNCEGCHSQIDASTKRNISLAQLTTAISTYSEMSQLKSMSDEDRSLIVLALGASQSPFDLITGTPVIAKTWDALTTQSCAAIAPPRDIVLLTRAQYANVMNDVLGLTVDVSQLPEDNRDFYMPTSTSGGIGINDVTHIESLYSVATAVAKGVSDNFDTVTKRFSTCTQSTAACQNDITLRLVGRFFRQRLSATDADYVAITSKFSTVTDFKTRLVDVVTATLMSPRFLYNVEYQKGFRDIALADQKVRSLSSEEIASRLSFLVWNSVPDDTLLDLAASQQLKDPAVLKNQLARMMADSRVQRFVSTFTNEWLNLDSINDTDKTSIGGSQTLTDKMKTETTTFISKSLSAASDVRQLFTTPKTYVESTLATLYAITGISGTAFVEAQRPGTSLQGGLLAQGSVATLTSTEFTDPIQRGLYTYGRFLCGRIADPPASAALVVISGTKYDQLQGRMTNTNCASCHGKFEPYGYALESLDGIGRSRTVDEDGVAVGRPVTLEDGSTVSSVTDIGQSISSNPLSGFCLLRNLEKYAYASAISPTRGLQCQTENELTAAFKSGNSLKAYLEALVLSSNFTQKMETR